MQFTISTLALTLAMLPSSLTASIGVPTIPDTETMAKEGNFNYCGDSSFKNKSNGGSPTIEDCKGLLTALAEEDPGFIRIPRDAGLQWLREHNTCVFGARSAGAIHPLFFEDLGPDATDAFIGTQDIIDLVSDSIAKMESEGWAGAWGNLPCAPEVRADIAPVTWGVFHS